MDWLTESPKMVTIYRNAYVVFAAHGSDLSLLKELHKCVDTGVADNKVDPEGSTVFVRQTIDHECFVNPPDDESSRFGRAWCFQERLFGSRILHFGRSWEEIWFECNVHLRCECGGSKSLA